MPAYTKTLAFPLGTKLADLITFARNEFAAGATRWQSDMWLSIPHDEFPRVNMYTTVRASKELEAYIRANSIYGEDPHLDHNHYLKLTVTNAGKVLLTMQYQQILGDRHLAIVSRKEAAKFLASFPQCWMRAQYTSKECTHQEYYGQFATSEVIAYVRSAIGEDTIKQSKDPHFNDIPLAVWDGLAPVIKGVIGGRIARANGSGGVSLSDLVCTTKAAARIIKESK